MRKLFEPNLILCGDLHAGELTPECRSDSYIDALCAKLQWLKGVQQKYHAPVVFPGDVFDRGSADSSLLNRLIEVWPDPKIGVLAITGQHDLKNHNASLQSISGFETLRLAGYLQDVNQQAVELPNGVVVCGCAWGQEPGEVPKAKYPVLVWHRMVWEKPVVPGQKPGEATRLLKRLSGWACLVFGDNHQTVQVSSGQRHLINAGSVARLRSDQKDFKPCIYLWQASTGELRQVFFPIAEGAVTDAKCAAEKERMERENAFVAKIEEGGDVACSFLDNVKLLLKDEPTEVEQVVMECVE